MGTVPSSSAAPGYAGLPTELTSFVGRESELAALNRLLDGVRLVTLTGAAGSGKTRLALELVSGRRAAGPAHWAELAPLRDPGLMAPAIAEATGLRGEIRAGDTAGLVRLLGGARALLVLDNCEHLVDACASLADRLLRECPGLTLLATSREALGVRGERAWLVPPLAVPDPVSGGDPTDAEAVRLFVERARDVAPGFALTLDNTPAVVEICRQLDGIPLAIELAAARVKVLSPADIRDRLGDVFRVLAPGGRTAVPRHRTMRAAIDWSHDLLGEDARALLRRLAVFRGGLTLDGAERVGAGDGLAEGQILELVATLVDRSLLGVREHHGATRYAFLEPVRQYAMGKLAESGEETAVRARHAAHVLALVEEAEPHLTRRERPRWVERLLVDLDNIRSALAWSRDHDPGLHVRLVGTLWWFWFSTRHWTEAGRWIEGALELPEAAGPTRERAELLFAAGALAALQVRTDRARPALEEAVALAAALGEGGLRAYSLNYLGMTYAGEARPEAVELCAGAETWFREHDDQYGLRLAALLQGSAALGRGDLATAEAKNLEGVRVARLFGRNRELAVALQNLAVVHLVQGRLDDAEPLVREAMGALREDPSLYFMATGVAYLGEIEAARGRHEEAARLLGAAHGLRERVGATAFPIDAGRQEAAVQGLRDSLGEPAFAAAWEGGRSTDPDALVRELAGDPAPGPAVGPGPGHRQAGEARGVHAAHRARRPDPVPGGDGAVELDVAALGPLLVRVDGEELRPDRWVYAKPRELLVYLLLHPNGGTRDQIGAALWPGGSRSSVKNSFHVTLHHLRKALGHPEWVVTEADRYRLAAGLRHAFDGDAFETRARAALREGVGPGTGGVAALRDILALYRGELLEGDPAGRWIDDHRDRLRRLQVQLILALGAALEPDRPEEAADLYHRLALREELDEEVHRRLMAAWNRAGDRVAALRHYERVVGLLRTELDADPEPETVALYESIRAG